MNAVLEPDIATGAPENSGTALALFQGHIDRLLVEHQREQQRIEALYQVIQGELRSAVSWFISGGDARDRWCGLPGVDRLFDREAALGALHAAYWSKAIALTDVMQTMPQKRKSEWGDLIREHKTPPFEPDTVQATLAQLLLERGRFFAEKVDGVFQRLSRGHVTNRPEGFWKRFIVDHAYSQDQYFAYPLPDAEGYLSDLREVIASFMGRGEPFGVGLAMREARANPGQWLHLDGGAWKIRAYKVGTLHIEVHPDMAWRLNCVLHELYPAAIPSRFREAPKRKPKVPPIHDRPLPFPVLRVLERTYSYGASTKLSFERSVESLGRDARAEAGRVLELLGGVRDTGGDYVFDYPVKEVLREVIDSGVIPDRKAHQFYPTPPAVAEALIEAADIDPEESVLEPSAGTGALAVRVPAANDLECVEISALYCRALEEALPGTKVHQADFLDWQPDRLFDRIVMNPPYANGRALAHVQHAMKWLKPGGRLVALLPAGLRGHSALQQPTATWGQVFESAFSGTSITTQLFIYDRPY